MPPVLISWRRLWQRALILYLSKRKDEMWKLNSEIIKLSQIWKMKRPISVLVPSKGNLKSCLANGFFSFCDHRPHLQMDNMSLIRLGLQLCSILSTDYKHRVPLRQQDTAEKNCILYPAQCTTASLKCWAEHFSVILNTPSETLASNLL